MKLSASVPTAPTPLIEAAGVVLSYGGERVLDNVDLTIRSGEIVTLIGPNGSGKSTLIKTLIGLAYADSGSIRRRPGLTIGYMPQKLKIDPVLPMSVKRFLRLTRNVPLGRRREALAEVGASYLLNAQMTELSGGEMQRVMLARALLREPDLLVLDEPAQGVDANGQIELYDLVERARTTHGCGVLLISHDLHLVMAQTDNVVCFNRHVCCSGAPERVANDPAYLNLFGRKTASALAVYQHHHDHDHDLHGRPEQPHVHGDACKHG